jgi:hypothetical protein
MSTDPARTAFELRYAEERGWCLRTARVAGYCSFPLPAENGLPAGGFGAVAIPAGDADEAEMIFIGLEGRGIARAEILPFGEGVLP